ncbi:MAG: RNA methyltransferase [Oscillospiraceae bacterium]
MADFIKSRDNEKVKYYCKLRDNAAFRHEENLFVAEGLKLCSDISAVIPPEMVFYTENAQSAGEYLGTQQYCVADTVAQKLSDVKAPQGVFCVFAMPKQNAQSLAKGSWLALENVQDPANVGAILRSAAAFNYKGVMLSGKCADVYCGKAIRASMGAAVKLSVLTDCDFNALFPILKKRGALTLAACLENSVPLESVMPKQGQDIVMVIGNEGQGITTETKAICDKAVRIPISAMVESLNAAAAASILLWHFRGEGGI